MQFTVHICYTELFVRNSVCAGAVILLLASCILNKPVRGSRLTLGYLNRVGRMNGGL